ncbi:trypsin-like peptidase domain-containing protein [Actinocorallia cavernae]|uniref:Trypsin-like peptidase domain-containing protein n=2 Tax=Actinomycetes TaxID=1760 RepID=A0ABN3KM57_9ACTN
MVRRIPGLRHLAVCAIAVLLSGGPAAAASTSPASPTSTDATDATDTVDTVDAAAGVPTGPNPVAARLDAYWTAARMTAALPADAAKGSETGPALSPAVDGPRPGEYIPPSRSFDGIPQAGTFFWTDAQGTGRTCSGSVVRGPGRDLVLSAGHCLKGYSGTAPQRRLAFVPQYHDGVKPYGVFPVGANGVYVPQQYYDLGEHAGAAYDFGFAVTEPNQDGTSLQDAVGGVRLLTGTGYDHAPVRMIGYPAGAAKPLECWSRTTRWPSDDPADPGTFPRIACDAFVGGTSGGPMLVPRRDGWAVIGVIGGYHTGGNTAQVSYSAYFGSATRALYDSATTGAPPAGPGGVRG